MIGNHSAADHFSASQPSMDLTCYCTYLHGTAYCLPFDMPRILSDAMARLPRLGRFLCVQSSDTCNSSKQASKPQLSRICPNMSTALVNSVRYSGHNAVYAIAGTWKS